MRALTGTTFASLFAFGLTAVGAVGCFVDVSHAPPDGTIPPAPLPRPACIAATPNAETVFTRTAGPNVARFRFVAATSGAVFASTGTSLHVSHDAGDTWSLVDAEPLRGSMIQAIASFGDEIFVSVYANDGPGLFRSKDQGATWTSASTDLVSVPSYLSSDGAKLFAQQFGQTFEWEPIGATWIALPTGDNGFDVIESDGTYLYGNGIYMPGVYRLALDLPDATWTPVTELPEWGYKAFAFDGVRGIAANGSQIFQSIDGGATWKATSDNPEVEDLLVVGDKIFAATYDGLLLSSDGGASWSKLGHDLFSTGFSLAASGDHLFTASEALRRAPSDAASLDAWQTLRPIGDAVHALVATQRAVLSMSEGHLLRSADGGATWSEVLVGGETANLSNLVVRRRPGGGDEIFALRYGGSGVGVTIVRSVDDGLTFTSQGAVPGDGAYVNFLSATDDRLIAGVTEGAGSGCQDAQDSTTTLYESLDGGATWVDAMNHFPTTFTDCYGETYTPGLTGFVETPDALFATSYWKGTFRSLDAGKSWHVIETPESIGAVSSVISVDGALVAIASGGGLARSVDRGATWTASGLGTLPVSSLVGADDVVFATVASADPSVAGVYASTDQGVVWTRVDTAFDARVSKVALQGGRLFAGTLDESVWSAPLVCGE